MLHRYFAPHPALLEYVDSFAVVTIDFAAAGSPSPIYPFVPTHTRYLCFYLSDPVKVKKQNGAFGARPRSIIIGPQLMPVTLDLGRHHCAVVVGLKPCSMFRLLGIPMAELVDRDYDAREVVGPEIDELLDRLQEARSSADKNDVMQQYRLRKLRQLKPALPFDRAMLRHAGALGNLPVERLAAQACLSLRQFERKCQERIGFTPKLYARMVRFSSAYKFKEMQPDATWLGIAHRCGYFDQMHLIRDFKAFAGITPGSLPKEALVNSVRFQTLLGWTGME